jgi:hypothetical protein
MSHSDNASQRSSRHPANQPSRPRFRFVPKRHGQASSQPTEPLDVQAPQADPSPAGTSTGKPAQRPASPAAMLRQSIDRAVDQTVERAKNKAAQRISAATGLPQQAVSQTVDRAVTSLSRRPAGPSHGSERFAHLTEPLLSSSPKLAELQSYAKEISDSLDEPDAAAAADRRRAVAKRVADKAPLHVKRTVYDSPVADVVEMLHAADVLELAIHAAIEAAVHVPKK